MIPAKIIFDSFKEINGLQERTKLLIDPDHAQEAQVACWFKCLYSPEGFWSRSSPHPWFVLTVCSPVCRTELSVFDRTSGTE